MDSLELVSVVKRLGEGECPICKGKLQYLSGEIHEGTLEKNGMSLNDNLIHESHIVYCKKCGYSQKAIQIGLKLIPIDRIPKTDINWDKKYLEENTLIFGKEGENPFYKKGKE